MDVFDCIKTRRSIRKFLQKPIEFDKIGRILEAGHYAPSPGNLQNWRFILVTDKDLISAAYGYCLKQECVFNASALIILCSLVDRVERFYGEKGKAIWNIQAVAAAAQNILLAAHDLGLGAVWVGAFNEAEVRSIFGIPNSAQPQAIIALGYPDEQPEAERDDLYTVVRFNNYGMPIKDLEGFLREYSTKLDRGIKNAKKAGGRAVHDGVKKGSKVMYKIRSKIKDMKEKKKSEKNADHGKPGK